MSQLLSFSSAMQYFGYIVIAILVLLLMVLIHEFGHYTAGKMLKFKINEFSVGFGPKILQKKKKNGELFTLRALPLGGYCAFDGETDGEANSPQAFNNQKPWKRIIVLFFGAFFNFLSAIIFSFILLLANGYDYVQVKDISPTSVNYSILEKGDVIVGVNNKEIDFVYDQLTPIMISDYLNKNYPKCDDLSLAKSNYIKDGKTYYIYERTIPMTVRRDGDIIDLDAVKINAIYNSNGGYEGWTLLNSEVDNGEFSLQTYKYSFGEALREAVPFTFKWAWKVLIIFGQLITGQLSITSLGGPITTINTIATFTQQSFSYLLVLLPLIAVNLAVFNLLPIPALDGFQIVFVIIEWIRKKPIKRETVNLINNIGLFALLGFVIIVDLLQFIL